MSEEDIFCPINKTSRGRRAGGLTSEGKDTSFQRDDGGEANHLTGQQSRSGDLAHRGRCSWRAVLYCTSMVTCKTSTCVDTYIRLISAISPATSETRKTSRTITPDYYPGLFIHTHTPGYWCYPRPPTRPPFLPQAPASPGWTRRRRGRGSPARRRRRWAWRPRPFPTPRFPRRCRESPVLPATPAAGVSVHFSPRNQSRIFKKQDTFFSQFCSHRSNKPYKMKS